MGIDSKDYYIGEDALRKRGVLKLTYPIENGIVINWDDMERIWHQSFYQELQVNLVEAPTFLIEAQSNPDSDSNRIKQSEIMFETLQVPNLS